MTQTTEREKLWQEVKNLQGEDAGSVLCYLFGWMQRDDHFFEGLKRAIEMVRERQR